MPTRKPSKSSRARSKTKAQHARASGAGSKTKLSKTAMKAKGGRVNTAVVRKSGSARGNVRAIQMPVSRNPRGSPPASAFPQMQTHRFAAAERSASSSSAEEEDDDDDDEEEEDGESQVSEWATESESDDDGEESSGSTNRSSSHESRDLKDAALLLMSVSPRLTARPRSMSDFGVERPLESLAGLAELGGGAAIGSSEGGVQRTYTLNQGYRLSAQVTAAQPPHGGGGRGGAGSSVFSGGARPRRMSEIDKLHACLSGLSRTASFGSLSSFQSDRSLFSAVAPYPFSRDLSAAASGRAGATGAASRKGGKKRPRPKKDASEGAGQKKKKKKRSKKPKKPKAGKSAANRGGANGKPARSKRSRKAVAAAAASHPAGPINPDCPVELRTKYGTVYNMNGRVGIYTPQQRLALLAKYRQKRTSRVWRKTVRYDCRKNLADSRLRIKGRFVRRDSEEAKAYFAKLKAELDQKTANVVKKDGAAPPAAPATGAAAQKIALAAGTQTSAAGAPAPAAAASTAASASAGPLAADQSAMSKPSAPAAASGAPAAPANAAAAAAPASAPAPTPAAAAPAAAAARAAAAAATATTASAAPLPVPVPAPLDSSNATEPPTAASEKVLMQGSATTLPAAPIGRRPRSISSIF